jgi:NitT/TauT family transport system substrate-binding protein
MTRRLPHFLIFLLLVAAIGCTPTASGGNAPTVAGPASGGGASSPPQTITKITYGEIGGTSDAGIYIAEEKGYFREQGLELDKTRFQTAVEMVAPLGTGQLDVGGGAPSAGLMNAVTRDVSVKIVADKGNLNPGFGFQALMIRKDLWDSGAARGPADLKGRSFANSGRDNTGEVTMDTFLRTGGLTIADVDVVTMAFPDMLQAFANGSIDAALVIEPWVTQIADAGSAVIVKRNDELTPRQQVAVIMYSPQFAEQKPDLARRFMLAYVKALRDYNDAFAKGDTAKREQMIDILIGATTVKSRPLYDKIAMPGLDPNGRVNTQSLDESQNWWVAKGSQRAKVDLAKVVDPQFAEWAVQQLGPY